MNEMVPCMLTEDKKCKGLAMLDTLGFHNAMCTAFEQEVATDNVPAIKALHELVQNLPDTMVSGVMDDLNDFELTGIISPRIETVLQRTLCLIHANQIEARI